MPAAVRIRGRIGWIYLEQPYGSARVCFQWMHVQRFTSYMESNEQKGTIIPSWDILTTTTKPSKRGGIAFKSDKLTLFFPEDWRYGRGNVIVTDTI
jgi:hypothetical protein